jgi:chromosome segregation ATPase
MSSIGKTVESSLPEDIESRIQAVEQEIADLDRKKFDLTESVKQKTAEEAVIQESLRVAKETLESVTKAIEEKELKARDREENLNNKESALNVYANALKEKEEKINKYLSVFEKMKKVIS